MLTENGLSPFYLLILAVLVWCVYKLFTLQKVTWEKLCQLSSPEHQPLLDTPCAQGIKLLVGPLKINEFTIHTSRSGLWIKPHKSQVSQTSLFIQWNQVYALETRTRSLLGKDLSTLGLHIELKGPGTNRTEQMVCVIYKRFFKNLNMPAELKNQLAETTQENIKLKSK